MRPLFVGRIDSFINAFIDAFVDAYIHSYRIFEQQQQQQQQQQVKCQASSVKEITSKKFHSSARHQRTPKSKKFSQQIKTLSVSPLTTLLKLPWKK